MGGWGSFVLSVGLGGSGSLRFAFRSFHFFKDPYAFPRGLRRWPCPPLIPGLDFSWVERLALGAWADPPLLSATF